MQDQLHLLDHCHGHPLHPGLHGQGGECAGGSEVCRGQGQVIVLCLPGIHTTISLTITLPVLSGGLHVLVRDAALPHHLRLHHRQHLSAVAGGMINNLFQQVFSN